MHVESPVSHPPKQFDGLLEQYSPLGVKIFNLQNPSYRFNKFSVWFLIEFGLALIHSPFNGFTLYYPRDALHFKH